MHASIHTFPNLKQCYWPSCEEDTSVNLPDRKLGFFSPEIPPEIV